MILDVAQRRMRLLPVSDEAAGVGGGVLAQLASVPLLQPGKLRKLIVRLKTI